MVAEEPGTVKDSAVPKRHDEDQQTAIRRRFGQRIGAAIQRDGRTQKDIAKAVGISPGNLSDYLKGRTQPGLVTLVMLADELNEHVSFLVGDRLHGKDSLESLGRDFAAIVGARRLRALLELPPETLQDEADRVIGRHADPGSRRSRKRA